jgi:hypothetical protein
MYWSKNRVAEVISHAVTVETEPHPGVVLNTVFLVFQKFVKVEPHSPHTLLFKGTSPKRAWSD